MGPEGQGRAGTGYWLVRSCQAPLQCCRAYLMMPCTLAQEIIAINQDELGVPGDLIWQQGTRRVSLALACLPACPTRLPASLPNPPACLPSQAAPVSCSLPLQRHGLRNHLHTPTPAPPSPSFNRGQFAPFRPAPTRRSLLPR